MPGSKISKAPENNSFAVTFLYLKLKEGKEDYMKVRKSKAGDSHASEGGI